MKDELRKLDRSEQSSGSGTYITLRQLKKDVESAISDDKEIIENIDKAFGKLDNVCDKENEYVTQLNMIKEIEDKIENTFDIDKYSKKMEELLEKIKSITKKDILKDVQPLLDGSNPKKIMTSISKITKKVDNEISLTVNLYKIVENEYENYKKNVLTFCEDMATLMEKLR